MGGGGRELVSSTSFKRGLKEREEYLFLLDSLASAYICSNSSDERTWRHMPSGDLSSNSF